MIQQTRRDFAKTAGAALVGSALARTRSGWSGYGRAIVVDALGGPGSTDPSIDPNAPLSVAMIEDVRSSGITLVNMTVGAVGNGPTVFEETAAGIAAVGREIDLHPDVFMKVTRPSHVDEAKKSGRLGIVFGFQDTTMFASDIQKLDLFFDAGVRIVQLTYNLRNLVGDGCLEEANAGLSRFGRALVARMNDLGVLVDLSHCGDRTTSEAAALSSKPVAITHTGCRALVDLPRNKRDEELRAVAEKGGVIGIYLMPFLRASGQPMAEDVVRHVEHAIDVCGEDHVGIGTDGTITGVTLTPEYKNAFRLSVEARRKAGISAPGETPDVYTFVPDLNTPRRFETLADRLLSRGHTSTRVEKIIGGNFARLFRDVFEA